MKFFKNNFFILISLVIFSSYTHGEGIKYNQFYLDKLKNYEESQQDLDLIFAEYCYFNNNDSICYEDEINQEKEIDTSDINAQIYYTTTNVNLRYKPDINSEVLSVINKNETVKVYEVSNENSNWFLVKYNNLQGYIYSDYLSKDQQVVSVDNTKKNNEYDIDQVDWKELTKEVLKICINDYLGIDSYNTKERHNNYCNCYSNGFKDLHTEDDILYFLDNDDYSQEFYEKTYLLEDKCGEEFNFIFDFSYDDETKEAIQDQIKICKNDYEENSVISKYDYYDWCKCYHNKSFILFLEDVVDNPDADKISNETKGKLEALENSCLSEIRN